MNLLYLNGNLTRDPEVGETASGTKYAKLGIAVNRNYTNSDGERETDFFNFTLWRERAELAGKYLRKGSKVGLRGGIVTRRYEDDEGNTRTVIDIKVDEIEFLSPKKAEEEEPDCVPKSNKKKPVLQAFDDDSDIPF